MPSRLHRRRFALTVVVAAFVAVVVVPNAAALRFTDASRLPPNGAVGSRYFHQFEGLGGCGPALPYQFRILNGAPPPGLSLASNGLVSGTPTQQGSWSFWVELSDQDPPSADWCRSAKSEEEFTINIGPKGSVPDASPPSGSGGGGVSLNPCNLPVVGNVCDAVAGAVKKAAAEAGEFVMRGVTAWVTNAAVWVAGKVGELIENTTSPDLTASWFEGQYGAMLAIAGALALLMLMLAVIQSVIRQDIWILVRAAFGYLPMAFILAGVAIAATGLLVAITDDMSAAVVASLGTEQSDNLLQAVGDAYKNALDEDSGIPLFGVFLGAIILAIGAFVLWLEMIIRDAAIYICVFFLPLTFVAMIWPATSRWARRLVELLVAIILAKFVIVSILTLATAAIANTGVVGRRRHHLRADARRLGAPRPRRLVAVRPPANDPDDGARRGERRPANGRPMSERRRIGRRPQPRRLHASGDGPAARGRRRPPAAAGRPAANDIGSAASRAPVGGRRGVAAFDSGGGATRSRRLSAPGRAPAHRPGVHPPLHGRTAHAASQPDPSRPTRPARIRPSRLRRLPRRGRGRLTAARRRLPADRRRSTPAAGAAA